MTSVLAAVLVVPSAQAADGGGIGLAAVVLLAAGALATLSVVLVSRERRRARDAAFVAVKDCARDDLVAVDDALHALRDDVDAPGAPIRAQDDHDRAAEAYARAEWAWKRACEPDELEAVSVALEEAQWALACARARMRDEPPPLRRPPCFFHPGHGPSACDVLWVPPYGPARPVPACEADADRVEGDADPEIRQVLAGRANLPWFSAGSAHAPYAAGFFGGRDAELLPSLLAGSALGAALNALRQAAPAGTSADGERVGPGRRPDAGGRAAGSGSDA